MMVSRRIPPTDPPSLSVAVVGICGASHLRRCLAALAAQEGAPPFEVLVVYDPALQGIEEVGADHPRVRFVCNQGQRTPLELASQAIRESRGEIVLLTEDHCVPAVDWVAELSASLQPGRAAAGGVVELAEEASAVDWAFYFVDFFRYAEPVRAGESPTLTVCNVAYRRSDLDSVSDAWEDGFHETVVNDRLRRSGSLYLGSKPRVSMRRHVRLHDALIERYAFGRLFGCTRLERTRGTMRVVYKLLGPALPPLLLGRMIRKAISSPRFYRRLAHGIAPLTLMVLAWSWGEWIGYLTETRPGDLTVAQEPPED
jgi:hypothetical protein